ncbi:MAG: phosphoribosylamine--glycine ligase [Bryobacteraceae bacterium]
MAPYRWNRDRFRSAGRLIFGLQRAAQLEGSKAYSKKFMTRHGIPTARFRTVQTMEDAWRAIDEITFPAVLKADGLAAGKGVVIAEDREQAAADLPGLIGSQLVVEEFLQGREVSFIVLCDGRETVPMLPAQDHKAAFDGDTGPNTGGMGAYCDASILTIEETQRIFSEVIQTTIEGMRAEGTPFSGFLYAGLMMTSEGPKVLEFNARLGDPETQALLHRLDSDFFTALTAGAEGNLGGTRLRWKPGASVCVVLASHGYPGETRAGDRIEGIEQA